MKSFLLGFLTLCVWCIPARYYYVCKIKNQCEDATMETPALDKERSKTLALSLGDSILLQGYEQFYFAPASAKPVLTDNNRDFLRRVAEQLLSDSLSQLSITAYFQEEERQIRQGFFDNLGMARADALRQLLGEQGVRENSVRLYAEEGKAEDLQQPALFELFYRTTIDSTTAKEIQ